MPRKKGSRSAQGAGTIRQRKDGTWEARYTASRDPGTGKQVQKSLYAKTQKEVLEKLQQLQTDIANGTHIEPSKITVGQWMDIWLKDYTGGVKQRTLKQYQGQVKYRIKPALGAVKLCALKPHQIQAFYNDAQKESKGKKALSPKSVKNLHGIMHKALEQAVEIGYLKSNPTAPCKLPRVEKTEIKPLDDVQITQFLKAIKEHPYELLYIVDLFTGMRQGEIMGLCWDCVDFKAGTILIRRQLQRIDGKYHLLSIKNDKTRKITPAPSIMGLLKEQKRRQAEWQLRAGPAWDNAMNLVFTNELGGHVVRETIYRNFKRIVKGLGIAEARFHDMRHSYAVAALQAGDDVKTVQQNLGHGTAAFTLDIYGHVSERMKRESAERMESFIKMVEKA